MTTLQLIDKIAETVQDVLDERDEEKRYKLTSDTLRDILVCLKVTRAAYVNHLPWRNPNWRCSGELSAALKELERLR